MKKVILADCLNGRVVRVGARWGVVCTAGRYPFKVVDFWDGGREYVQAWKVVEVQT